MVPDGATVCVVFFDPAVIIALTLELWKVATTVEEPENLFGAAAAKVADVAPAGIASEAGTVNFRLLLVKPMVMPEVGAGPLKVVVHELLVPAAMMAGAHTSFKSEIEAGETVSDTVCAKAKLALAITGAPVATGA